MWTDESELSWAEFQLITALRIISKSSFEKIKMNQDFVQGRQSQEVLKHELLAVKGPLPLRPA